VSSWKRPSPLSVYARAVRGGRHRFLRACRTANRFDTARKGRRDIPGECIARTRQSRPAYRLPPSARQARGGAGTDVSRAARGIALSASRKRWQNPRSDGG